MAKVSAWVTYVDHSNEKSTVGFNILNILSDDLATITVAALQARVASLQATMSGISLGADVSHGFTVTFPDGGTPPASALAQRENKWLVSYVDSLEYFDAPTNTIPNLGFGKTFTLEIPTATLGAGTPPQPPANSDEVDISLEPFASFVTDLEDYHFSPYGGNITVTAIKYVGSNN